MNGSRGEAGRTRVITALAVAAALSADGCGARTGLAGPDASTDAAPLGCARRLAVAAPGTVLWTVPFDSTAAGPVAADPSGATYFVVADQDSGMPGVSYSVVSLDACGAVRWRSASMHSPASLDVRPTALVSGDRLIVQVANVDAFDLATGAHRWTADLPTFGQGAGLGDVLHDEDGLVGPAAASRDGTLFVPYGTTSGNFVLRVDASGTPSVFSRDAARRPGTMVSLIVDAAGRVDVLINSPLDGAEAVSLDTNGAVRFAASFDCTQSFIGPLASGRSFIAQQDGLCGLGFDGSVRWDDHAQSQGAMVIDADDNAYFPLGQAFGSDDVSGRARWSTPLNAGVFPDAVLGERHVFGLLFADREPALAAVVALDRATGAIAWRGDLSAQHLPTLAPGNPWNSAGLDGMLLAAPGLLVVGGATAAVGVATGGERGDATASWPTPRGGADQRAAAAGL